MAQLVISTAASAFAAPSLGAFAARAAGRLAAGYAAGVIDAALFGPRRRAITGPRLETIHIQASTEGAPILRVYGRARIAGQVIWAAKFRETASAEASGGKGGRARPSGGEYLYTLSFAVGLCEGEIDGIGRVWADGKPLALADYDVRIYHGTEEQLPDGVIEAVESAGNAPAFRGTAYVVFEDMPLAAFGNRVPQLSFEVMRSIGGGLERALRAVDLIPASGEFAYATSQVTREVSEGISEPENAHNAMGVSDFTASLDLLEAQAPNSAAVALVAAWFGTDLRAGVCEIRPGVETREKETAPLAWRSGGAGRADAHLVSRIGGRPAYGGTPSDASLIEAIEDLSARGLEVMFYPFLLMDIAAGNALADPATGAAGQGAYSWRGRIAAAFGTGGTADAASQVAALFGTASPADFSIVDGEIVYSGPEEWSLRRMILHYATLCKAAGGVESFLIGSEMRGLTTIRDNAGGYPAVAAFRALAADVRAIVGAGTKISYAADWSEYFGHHPGDGTDDVLFHLDPLWADSNIDFVGIDNYMPLSDWRDGRAHLDAVAGAPSVYDLDYLKGNIRGGEGYDWYYASVADRAAQTRTSIADGAYGEDWVFRYKDLWNWWASAHYDRPGGVRALSPSAWVPQGKPIRFTEIGCPALDKGANQPNVFLDPKSAESDLPYFSNGGRDDYMQRRFLEAHHAFWSAPENNPVSSVYGGRMLREDRLYVYCWDARPYPAFPADAETWGDAENWERGHWLTGRIGRAPLAALVAALAGEAGFSDVDVSQLSGLVTGYVLDRPMSPRDAIEPLMAIYQFDAVETGGRIAFVPRGGASMLTIAAQDLVEGRDGPYRLTRAQETDLPTSIDLAYADEGTDYAAAIAEARDPAGRTAKETRVEIAAVIESGEARARAEAILADAWVMREGAAFALPPSRLAVEPADVVTLDLGARAYDMRISDLTAGAALEVEAVRTAAEAYDLKFSASRRRAGASSPVFGAPVAAVLDLPLLRDEDAPFTVRAAAFARPWPAGVGIWRGGDAGAPVRAGTLSASAVMGRLQAALGAGRAGRWTSETLRVRLFGGALSSRERADVLNGANVAAVMSDGGEWEVLQFAHAVLGEDGVWTLTDLLRGQAGSLVSGASAGAMFVLLDAAAAALSYPQSLLGAEFDFLFGPQDAAPAGTTGDAFRTVTASPDGLGLRPLSPVHVRARLSGDDIWLSWLRRTRIGGDGGWEAADVPLGEVREAYEVDILDGGAVVRTLTSAAPETVYARADIAADFGAVPETLTVAVYQLSEVFGRGAAAQAALRVQPDGAG